MIVSDVRHYLAERGEASTMDVAVHFGINPNALQGILGLLASKDYIRQQPSRSSACGMTCSKCVVSNCETQRWLSLS